MTASTIDEVFATVLAQRFESSPFSAKLGIRCESIERDRVVILLPFEQANTTIADVVHGGAIGSLADIAATAAAWSGIDEPAKYRGLTIDMSLCFLSAARGQTLRAEGVVSKRGRTICYCDVSVTNEAGDLVAKAIVAYKLSRIFTEEETLAGLFAGKPIEEQRALLAKLERAGASMYRAWAEQEGDASRRQELERAAQREEDNAAALEAMKDGAGNDD